MGLASTRWDPPAARWLLVAVVAGCILVASVVPVPTGGLEPLGPLGIVGLDAWIHALAYAGLAGSIAYALSATELSTPQVVVVALGLAMAFGFCLELLQAPLPARQFEVSDLVANGVGATAAATGWWIASRLLLAHPVDGA